MLLITGANGQLGTELRKIMPDALFADVEQLDITDFGAVENYVKNNNIDTIINCAAYTAVDRAEEDVELATKINVVGPLNLAKSGATIIHISTDYVFDGTAHNPYTPADEPNPKSVYGKTKLDGENAVLENASTAIIIRTAWLYSAHGNNFVKTMRRLGDEKESLNVVFDQVGTPCFAGDFARAIADIIPQIKPGQHDVYHYSNEGVCSWYDFAYMIMKLSGLSCVVNPILSAQYPTPAPRPAYSVLDKTKIKTDFNLHINHWEKGLEECLKQF